MILSTSVALGRLVSFVLLAIVPIYLAVRGSDFLSDTAIFFSTLSESAERLHVVFSPVTAASAIHKHEEIPKGSKISTDTLDSIKDWGGRSNQFLPNRLASCINSFEQYRALADRNIERKHTRYSGQSPMHKMISNKLGYSAHFEKARQGIDLNARLVEKAAQMGRKLYKTGTYSLEEEEDADFGLVYLALGHLMRDWSTQGRKERQAVFPPVLDGLRKHFDGSSIGKQVLVPGSGMGRLASDIADAGYSVTANDLDYGSILIHHLLTNYTTSLHEHTLQPFVTEWAHQANPNSRYNTISVPDQMPNKTVKLVEGDFLEVFPQDGQFDAVVTLFFIDMSDSVIDFLSNVNRLLKPGGVWINLGPLKWYPSSDLQLSAEEVLRLAELLDFIVDYTSRKSIHSVYGE